MYPNKYNKHNLVIFGITRLNSLVPKTKVNLKFLVYELIFHAMMSHYLESLSHHR